MAKLSALISCLSDVLEMPRTAIEAYVKPLRKEGMIASKGKGGPASPEMNSHDAATIIEGILGGTTTKVVERVSIISRGSVFAIGAKYNDRKFDFLRCFYKHLGIDVSHSFHDILCLLIDVMKNDDFSILFIKWFLDVHEDLIVEINPEDLSLWIKISHESVHNHSEIKFIIVRKKDYERMYNLDFSYGLIRNATQEEVTKYRYVRSDLHLVIQVGHRTISSVSRLLHE